MLTGYKQRKVPPNALSREKVLSVIQNPTLYRSLNFSSKDEIAFRRLLNRTTEQKFYDTFVSFPLQNSQSLVSPVYLNLVSTGPEAYQRTGCKIILTELEFTLQIQYPTTTVNSPLLLSIPESVFRYAIVFVKGKIDTDFDFSRLFVDYDKFGDMTSINDFIDDSNVINPINAFSYMRSGSTKQGYEQNFAVIKEDFLHMSGFMTTKDNAYNGTYRTNLFNFCDSRYSQSGEQFHRRVISLIDQNLYSSANQGNPFMTSFENEQITQGTIDNVTTGSLLFIYGTSYIGNLEMKPTMTLFSRLKFIDQE